MPDTIEIRHIDGGVRWFIWNETTAGENFAEKWNRRPERAEAFYAWHERFCSDLAQLESVAGIDRGVFPAAFLARLEEHLEYPIGRYFDLIAGASTGGIIAIGLGLGLSAGDILKRYVEQGPAIFDQEHGAIENWVRKRLRGVAHLFVTKHSSEQLRRALEGVLGRRKLGESRTRLVIPAWHPVLERVYIYKTAHHPRLETDYRQPAIDAAMATAARRRSSSRK